MFRCLRLFLGTTLQVRVRLAPSKPNFSESRQMEKKGRGEESITKTILIQRFIRDIRMTQPNLNRHNQPAARQVVFNITQTIQRWK